MILTKRNLERISFVNFLLLLICISNNGKTEAAQQNPPVNDNKKCENTETSKGNLKEFVPDASLGSCLAKNDFLSECDPPADCEDYFKNGFNKSGVYKIWPMNKIMNGSIQVYCDMDTDEGGWTVVQRRGNFLRAADYFSKDWANYKEGFGDIEKDFWLGNDNIFALTNQKEYSVRFDLWGMGDRQAHALYDIFFIEDESRFYTLTIEDYSGTAGNSMEVHNKQRFSTKDRDNDKDVDNCAETFQGGWWYNACQDANLNGLYITGQAESYTNGIVWKTFTGSTASLDKAEIKIRGKNFRSTCLSNYN